MHRGAKLKSLFGCFQRHCKGQGMKYSNILFSPSDGSDEKQRLFCAMSCGTFYDRPRDCLLMKAFASITFNGYFNVFPVKFAKDELSCGRVRLRIKGRGKVIATLICAFRSSQTGVMSSQEIDLSENGQGEIAFSIDEIEPDSLVYPRIDARTDAEIESMSYHIDPVPGFEPRQVSLGVVITHYNRQLEVSANLRALESYIRRRPELSGKIRVAVVDNSSNFVPGEGSGAEVIRCPNFGGSGGFTRGLLHFQKSGATHVLFMDDDGDFEPESIARLCCIFALCRDPSLAITGTLLDAFRKTVIDERGATFDVCSRYTMSNGFDMAQMQDMLEVESYDRKYNYSAWCFFAYRVADVRFYPYPFFIRGDDTLFSIQNAFNARPLIGIGCWIPGFVDKIGPRIWYLDTRANLICSFFVDSSIKPILQTMRRFFFKQLYMYNYGSAKAILKACQDVFEDRGLLFNDFSGKHISAVVSEIERSCRSEKLADVGLVRPDLSRNRVPGKNFFLRIASKATLNGLLLPSFLCHKHVIYFEVGDKWGYNLSFCRRSLFYYSKCNNYGYRAVRNPRQGIGLFMEYMRTIKLVRSHYKSMSEYYRKLAVDREFWERVYGLGEDK